MTRDSKTVTSWASTWRDLTLWPSRSLLLVVVDVVLAGWLCVGFLQFGSCLTPADLATWRGWALNLAAWSIKQLVQPLQAGLLPNVWAAERDALQLPRASSGCPLVDAWQRAVSGRPVQQCDVLLNVVLGSWLLEHPRPLAPYQVLVGPGTPRPAQPIVDPKAGRTGSFECVSRYGFF